MQNFLCILFVYRHRSLLHFSIALMLASLRPQAYRPIDGQCILNRASRLTSGAAGAAVDFVYMLMSLLALIVRDPVDRRSSFVFELVQSSLGLVLDVLSVVTVLRNNVVLLRLLALLHFAHFAATVAVHWVVIAIFRVLVVFFLQRVRLYSLSLPPLFPSLSPPLSLSPSLSLYISLSLSLSLSSSLPLFLSFASPPRQLSSSPTC